MKHKNISLLTLCIIVALVMSPMIVQAAESSQTGKIDTGDDASAKPWAFQFGNQTRTKLKQHIETRANQLKKIEQWNWRNKEKLGLRFDEAELPNLDEVEVDDLIDEYEALLDAEDAPKGKIWILVARGRSWEIDVEPVTDEMAPGDCTRIGMKLAIRTVRADDRTIVFRVVRGCVFHDGEKTEVAGAGVLRKDGTFAVRLNGEGLRLKAFGRAFKVRGSYFVLMKGRTTLEGEGEHAFLMRGRAFKLRRRRPLTAQTPEETVEPAVPS